MLAMGVIVHRKQVILNVRASQYHLCILYITIVMIAILSFAFVSFFSFIFSPVLSFFLTLK